MESFTSSVTKRWLLRNKKNRENKKSLNPYFIHLSLHSLLRSIKDTLHMHSIKTLLICQSFTFQLEPTQRPKGKNKIKRKLRSQPRDASPLKRKNKPNKNQKQTSTNRTKKKWLKQMPLFKYVVKSPSNGLFFSFSFFKLP